MSEADHKTCESTAWSRHGKVRPQGESLPLSFLSQAMRSSTHSAQAGSVTTTLLQDRYLSEQAKILEEIRVYSEDEAIVRISFTCGLQGGLLRDL